jgi:hypothetical protein
VEANRARKTVSETRNVNLQERSTTADSSVLPSADALQCARNTGAAVANENIQLQMPTISQSYLEPFANLRKPESSCVQKGSQNQKNKKISKIFEQENRKIRPGRAFFFYASLESNYKDFFKTCGWSYLSRSCFPLRLLNETRRKLYRKLQ